MSIFSQIAAPPKSPNSTNAPRAAEGQFYNVFAGEQQQQQQQLTRFPSFITSQEHGHFPGISSLARENVGNIKTRGNLEFV